MQDVLDASFTAQGAMGNQSSAETLGGSDGDTPAAAHPHLRLVFSNPEPRVSTTPRSLHGDLARRLARRWAVALVDDQPKSSPAPATSVQTSGSQLAPIIPLFPHRRP